MIVLSMKPEEIYQEIMRDFVSIKRKAHMEGMILQQERQRKKQSNLFRIISYKTPHLNQWQIIISADPVGIKRGFYLKSRDSRGLAVYMIQFLNGGTHEEEKFVIKYNQHFFDRYNERMGLGLSETSKVIAQFFKYNLESDMGETETLPNGICALHFVFPQGMGIGWKDEARKTIHVKTFIPNETLSKKLCSLAELIKSCGDDEFFINVKLENIEKAF
jgi:hypothetical protein